MMQFLLFCKKIDGVVFGVQRWLLIILCVAITAVNIAQIAGRYLFFYSLPWSEQLSVILFIMIIFLGQNLATKGDGEIRIEVFLFCKPATQRIFLVVSDLLCLFSAAALFVSSIMLVMHASEFPQVISSLQLPYFYVFSIMPVGFFMIFFSRLGVMLRRFYPLPAEAAPHSEEPV